jgi:GntR family transcriptional regulator
MLEVDPKDPTPIYAQLDRAIRAEVATGRLPAGTQLPTVRQLAVDLRINANTVARVYAELERAGVLETRRGVGTFITGLQPERPARTGANDARLRSLVTRFIGEAAALGYTTEDVMTQFRELRRGSASAPSEAPEGSAAQRRR